MVAGAARKPDDENRIGPQPGPQTAFLSSSADIVIYGGGAGSGKTYGLLLEPLRHVHNPGFGSVIFRRKTTDITKEGGLWDEAMTLYQMIGAVPRSGNVLDHRFPAGAKVAFGHLQYNETVLEWHSAQIALLMFDELQTFTKYQFFYMLTRNRSVCGVRPYVRATCNPDADSWLADFLAWWIDEETGYPISEPWWPQLSKKYQGVERSGKVRWLIKVDEDLFWFDSYDEAIAWRDENGLADDFEPKSVTFIPGRLDDNPALTKKDPSYRANLYLQDRVTRERLLGGNWKIRATGGQFFKRADFEIVESDAVPRTGILKRIRYWDFAGTAVKRSRSKKNMQKLLQNDPDWTVGTKGFITKDKIIYIEHVVRTRSNPSGVTKLFKQTVEADGKQCVQWIEQEPGSSGKMAADFLKKLMIGYAVRAEPVSGSKHSRIEPYQAYTEGGNIKIVRGEWNEWFLDQHDGYPDPMVHDDAPDSASGLFAKLTGKGPSTTDLMVARHRRKQ